LSWPTYRSLQAVSWTRGIMAQHNSLILSDHPIFASCVTDDWVTVLAEREHDMACAAYAYRKEVRFGHLIRLAWTTAAYMWTSVRGKANVDRAIAASLELNTWHMV